MNRNLEVGDTITFKRTFRKPRNSGFKGAPIRLTTARFLYARDTYMGKTKYWFIVIQCNGYQSFKWRRGKKIRMPDYMYHEKCTVINDSGESLLLVERLKPKWIQ